MIAPRVTNQAKSKNYSSRALKWGILCICSLTTLGVTIKFEKKNSFFNFYVFVKKLQNHYTKLQKMRKFKNSHSLFLIIFPLLCEL